MPDADPGTLSDAESAARAACAASSSFPNALVLPVAGADAHPGGDTHRVPY
jgi:hypothetical protein